MGSELLEVCLRSRRCETAEISTAERVRQFTLAATRAAPGGSDFAVRPPRLHGGLGDLKTPGLEFGRDFGRGKIRVGAAGKGEIQKSQQVCDGQDEEDGPCDVLAAGLDDIQRPENQRDDIQPRHEEREEPPTRHVRGPEQRKQLQHGNPNKKTVRAVGFETDQMAAVASEKIQQPDDPQQRAENLCADPEVRTIPVPPPL